MANTKIPINLVANTMLNTSSHMNISLSSNLNQLKSSKTTFKNHEVSDLSPGHMHALISITKTISTLNGN